METNLFIGCSFLDSETHNVLMAVYEQEMLFLLAQGYEENGEIEKAIQILTWLWQQRKKGGDPEEIHVYYPLPCMEACCIGVEHKQTGKSHGNLSGSD